MCALYAMARRIDDIGDDVHLDCATGPTATGPTATGPTATGPTATGPTATGPTATGPTATGPVPQARKAGTAPAAGQLAALEEVRASLALLSRASGGPAAALVPPGDPVLIALADCSREFPLPVPALEQLVEGCEWDVAGRSYDSIEELVEYCRRVAGTIGRLSLAVFGSSDPAAAEPLADALGVALQLTNILRDLVEDRDVMDRVYLPRQDLERFDVSPRLEGKPDDLMALICFETGRAAEWYDRGLPLLELLDGRSRACTAAMAGIYRRLLDKMRGRPDRVLSTRAHLSPAEKTTVAALALARGLR
jgi:phytoene synthase